MPAKILLTRERPSDIARLDRERSLHRLRPGAYVRAQEWEQLKPWDRYRLRVEAVARIWESPLFCMESAAVLQGIPTFGEPREIHLLSHDGRSWREGDVVVHGSRDARDVTMIDGIAVTSIAETATDLCRVLPPAFALAVADATVRVLEPAGVSLDVSARGRSQANRRGRRQLDWVQARVTPLAESPGESVSRAVIEWLGYEEPQLQQEFDYEGEHDRSDFYWRRARVIGESDGYGKYDADTREAMQAHFVREKKREDRLRRYESGFARWDWSDTIRHARLDKKLAAAGLTRARPRQDEMLASLIAIPRSLPARTREGSTRPEVRP
jgi:hypothetical protein